MQVLSLNPVPKRLLYTHQIEMVIIYINHRARKHQKLDQAIRKRGAL